MSSLPPGNVQLWRTIVSWHRNSFSTSVAVGLIRFVTTSDRLGSGCGGVGQGDAVRQYVAVPTPDELPGNDYTATNDTADNFFDRFASMRQDCREANANVTSTVGRALGLLLDLVKHPLGDGVVVARINNEIKEAVENHQEADAILASRGTELAQYCAKVTSLTGELTKEVVGLQTGRDSLDGQDSDIAKV